MIILDTNVLSEVMKPLPESRVADWMIRERSRGLFTTAMTEAELLFGIALLPDGKRKRELDAAAQRVLALFSGRILGFDSAAARAFADISSRRRRSGRPIDEFDAQIAAIARCHGMAVATRDIGGFSGIGVALIDPWQ